MSCDKALLCSYCQWTWDLGKQILFAWQSMLTVITKQSHLKHISQTLPLSLYIVFWILVKITTESVWRYIYVLYEQPSLDKDWIGLAVCLCACVDVRWLMQRWPNKGTCWVLQVLYAHVLCKLKAEGQKALGVHSILTQTYYVVRVWRQHVNNNNNNGFISHLKLWQKLPHGCWQGSLFKLNC